MQGLTCLLVKFLSSVNPAPEQQLPNSGAIISITEHLSRLVMQIHVLLVDFEPAGIHLSKTYY